MRDVRVIEGVALDRLGCCKHTRQRELATALVQQGCKSRKEDHRKSSTDQLKVAHNRALVLRSQLKAEFLDFLDTFMTDIDSSVLKFFLFYYGNKVPV